MATSQCLVCLDEVPTTDIIYPPCCSVGGSTQASLCPDCVVTLIPDDPAVGRCPFCRAFLRRRHRSQSQPAVAGPAGAAWVLQVHRDAGECVICSQSRALVARHPQHANVGICSACDLGRRLPLVYECTTCRGPQRIPHPMWRYQPTPTTETVDTWICRRCADQRRWILRVDQLPLVPPEEVPDAWGGREQYLAAARARVAAQRQAATGPAAGPADGGDRAHPRNLSWWLVRAGLAAVLASFAWNNWKALRQNRDSSIDRSPTAPWS